MYTFIKIRHSVARIPSEMWDGLIITALCSLAFLAGGCDPVGYLQGYFHIDKSPAPAETSDPTCEDRLEEAGIELIDLLMEYAGEQFD